MNFCSSLNTFSVKGRLTIVARLQGSGSILGYSVNARGSGDALPKRSFHLYTLRGRLGLIRGRLGISPTKEEGAVLAETIEEANVFYPICIFFVAMLANHG